MVGLLCVLVITTLMCICNLYVVFPKQWDMFSDKHPRLKIPGVSVMLEHKKSLDTFTVILMIVNTCVLYITWFKYL